MGLGSWVFGGEKRSVTLGEVAPGCGPGLSASLVGQGALMRTQGEEP